MFNFALVGTIETLRLTEIKIYTVSEASAKY
jgi:hypothetical protein